MIYIACPKCGSRMQFNKVVKGACYEIRYYLPEDGSTVVNVSDQKCFDVVDGVTFVCASCGADLSDDDATFDTLDENGDSDVRGQLMTKYREYMKDTGDRKQKALAVLVVVEEKLAEFEQERELWQAKAREAIEDGDSGISISPNAVREFINQKIEGYSDLIFLMNKILKAEVR